MKPTPHTNSAALALIVMSIVMGIEPAMAGQSRLFEKPGIAVEALVDGRRPVVVIVRHWGVQRKISIVWPGVSRPSLHCGSRAGRARTKQGSRMETQR